MSQHSLCDAEQSAALDAIGELLAAHFDSAVDSADDEGRFSLAFRACFDRSQSPTKLKVTCRLSKVTTDEIEMVVDKLPPKAGTQA
jgi:hypothetical protein